MNIDLNFIGIIIAAVMASSVPLILAATGELIVERSGVLNLGVEGMIIIGAISGFAFMMSTESYNFFNFWFLNSDPSYSSCANWLGTYNFWDRSFGNAG